MDEFFRMANPFGLRFFNPRPKKVVFDPWSTSADIDCLAPEAVRVARERNTIFVFTLNGITMEVGPQSTEEKVKAEFNQRCRHEETVSGSPD